MHSASTSVEYGSLTLVPLPRAASATLSGRLGYRIMTTNTTPDWTPKQGQYLAFIYYYTKIMGQPPAESDFQRYFRVSPPSVHQMIVTLVQAWVHLTRRQAKDGRFNCFFRVIRSLTSTKRTH